MPDNKAQAARNVGKSVCVKDPELIKTIENIHRPANAFATGTYAGAGTFEEGFDDKKIPKTGVYAAAGVGYARAEEGIFEAEAKGPNASAGVGASLASGARAFAKAEAFSASAAAGPAKATVGLAVDTGVGIGPNGVEAKVLGTGVTIGPTVSVSFLGSSLELNLW